MPDGSFVGRRGRHPDRDDGRGGRGCGLDISRRRRSEWLVCGGGRHNPALMEALSRRLQAPVRPVEAVGWDGDALEAQAFRLSRGTLDPGLAAEPALDHRRCKADQRRAAVSRLPRDGAMIAPPRRPQSRIVLSDRAFAASAANLQQNLACGLKRQLSLAFEMPAACSFRASRESLLSPHLIIQVGFRRRPNLWFLWVCNLVGNWRASYRQSGMHLATPPNWLKTCAPYHIIAILSTVGCASERAPCVPVCCSCGPAIRRSTGKLRASAHRVKVSGDFGIVSRNACPIPRQCRRLSQR